MKRWLGFAAIVAALTVGGMARAGTPFGGEDSGTIPTDSPKGPVTKCENKVAKAVAKLVGAVGKCHASVASGKVTDDEACEGAALAKFGKTSTKGCPSCINLSSLGAAAVQVVDANNNRVYCAGSTPFGGVDDMGFLPPDAATKGPITKCENGVNKAVGKLAGAIAKCHIAEASRKGDDESCENTALTKFAATKTAGCTPCVGLISRRLRGGDGRRLPQRPRLLWVAQRRVPRRARAMS